MIAKITEGDSSACDVCSDLEARQGICIDFYKPVNNATGFSICRKCLIKYLDELTECTEAENLEMCDAREAESDEV